MITKQIRAIYKKLGDADRPYDWDKSRKGAGSGDHPPSPDRRPLQLNFCSTVLSPSRRGRSFVSKGSPIAVSSRRITAVGGKR